MLDEVFEGLGLKEEEVKIYTALLDHGPITVGKLAKQIGIPRPSMYGYMDRLTDMELVSEDDTGHVKNFYAESVDRLNILYMKKMSDLRSRQKVLQNILPDLKGKSLQHFIKPQFEHFKGEDAFLAVVQRLLNQGINRFGSLGLLPNEPWFGAIDAMRLEAGLEYKALIFLPQIFDYMGGLENTQARSMDCDTIPKMGYLLLGQCVVYVSTKNQFSGYVVDHSDSVEMTNIQFDLIWQKAHHL